MRAPRVGPPRAPTNRRSAGRAVTFNGMAHFLVLVLIDAADPDPAARARLVMRRYWDESGDADNPDAKCDGFVVGGRYDGIIWGKEQHYNLKPHEFQQRYGLDVVRPEDNIRPVPELVPDVLPYAVVTPGGHWLDREQQAEAGWREVVRSTLARHRTCIAVAIDCHH